MKYNYQLIFTSKTIDGPADTVSVYSHNLNDPVFIRNFLGAKVCQIEFNPKESNGKQKAESLANLFIKAMTDNDAKIAYCIDCATQFETTIKSKLYCSANCRYRVQKRRYRIRKS